MDTTTTAEKDRAFGLELMRLMRLAREESLENLLSAALGSREQNVESIKKLFHFVLRNFGSDLSTYEPSKVTSRYWAACSTFLKDAGLTAEQLEAIHKPFPLAGEPGFESVLDEFETKDLLP